MKRISGVGVVLFAISITGCTVVDSDPGPVQTSSESVDIGAARAVRAEIHMGVGELKIDGGSAKLMEGSFRYSERLGKPAARYDVTGSQGRLVVESPNKSSSGGKWVNDWTLKLGSAAPLDLKVDLGAGNADVNLSTLPLHSAEVHLGAGDVRLNLAGKYDNDVTVNVEGGAGEAKIVLPRDMGAVVKATMGLGNVNATGLSKRDGAWYNNAYAEGKPAVHVDVKAGVGNVTLSVE